MSLADDFATIVEDALERVLDRRAEQLERPVAVTADEAARLLCVSRRQVDRWVAEGLLPRVPHTASVRIPRVAIDAFAMSGVGE